MKWVSFTKLFIGILNLIKRISCRLLNYITCCDYEERKVLRQLLQSGEIDEAKYEELCEECSNGIESLDCGCNDFLQKPFRPEELSNKLKELLDNT